MRQDLLILLLAVLVILPAQLHADELIHFDCVADGQKTTADKPINDPINDPPNNRQCLATDASVLGKGTVHPNLEIRSPAGSKVLKNRTAIAPHSTFVAPNDYRTNSNCFEFLDQGRREIASGQSIGSWGFGDTTVCDDKTCGKQSAKPELEFVFHDITVDQFSVKMLDWADYRPRATENDEFQVTLTAFNASNDVVDQFSYQFNLTGVGPGAAADQKFVGYECVRETGNSCDGSGSDLWAEGDACVANESEPGYLTLKVDGSGISRLELRFPSHGIDPNVGFDSIRFRPD